MITKNALQIFYLTLICTFFSAKISAQDSINTSSITVRSLNKFKLYLIGIGVEREQKITKSSTVYFGLAVESVVPFFPQSPPNASDILRISHAINLAPVYYVGFKKYYNLQERAETAKTIANNSGSFFGFEYDLIAPILINNLYTTRYVSSFSPIWGFQRNTLKHTNIEFMIGPSYQTDYNRHRISLLAKIGFNYLL